MPYTTDTHVVLDLMGSITGLIERQRKRGSLIDYYTSPLIGQMLVSFIGLLSALELGQTLDAGVLDTWARGKAEQIGFDIDTETMK